jgi:hypothetical protein
MKTYLFAAALTIAHLSAQAIESIGLSKPDLDARVCNQTYYSLDNSYKLKIPDIGKRIVINDQVIHKGITSHLTLTNADSGSVYLVSTKVKSDFLFADEVLDRIEARMLSSIGPHSRLDYGKRGKGKFGRTFEFVHFHAVSTGFFGADLGPYPIVMASKPPRDKDTIERLAVHRYFVADGYMYEIAALVNANGNLSGSTRDELIAKGNEWLDVSLANLTPGYFEECNRRN